MEKALLEPLYATFSVSREFGSINSLENPRKVTTHIGLCSLDRYLKVAIWKYTMRL